MEAPVSVSLGVIRSLPAKLERLLSPEDNHRLQKGEKTKIRLLKDHLQELIDKYLMEPSESEVEVPTSSVARCWVKDVRELSYDIDDFLDELVHGLNNNAAASSHKNLRGKIAKVRDDRSRSRWVTDETTRFKSRLEEAIQRHKRYNLDKLRSDTSRIDSDEAPIPPLYGTTASRLVGIRSSMEKLEEWLMSDGEQGLRVVSIVGSGGIGKTTLAKELYSKLRRQFECRAFARSSQKPDMRRLLTSILLQVRRHQLPNDLEMGNLTETIRTFLQHKKYFIVIDDLWDSSTWDVVYRALPDDKCCSRVLTTTEIDIVAQRCCGYTSKYAFYMEPLSDKDSSELFFSRFVRNESGNSGEFDKVSSQVVRKCGGFPLATIAAASILARQKEQIDHCIYISKSLSSNLRTNANVEGMKQVLSLCYTSLPDRLKACMLYLSIYKQGHIIWKDDLVKQWIAEGFICSEQGKYMDEIAGTYFDELVNGGMIQPVDINYNGEVISCTVHYMVLNVIKYRCIEENFVTAIDYCQTNTRLADKVRRLSLHFGDVDDAESPSKLRLSQVRSLVFFGLLKSLPPMVEFRLLRVLILHLWGDRDNVSLDLTTVCKLFRLRNLDISCNVTLDLKIQLYGLEHLETLKIDSRVSEVPHDIILLRSLLHLSLPGDINLPNGIGSMTSLRTLGCFDLSRNSADNVQSLGELNNVRDLHLTCSTIPSDNLEENVGYLASILWKLTNLKSLNLSTGVPDENTLEATASSNNNVYFDGLNSVSSPPALLEKLEFSPRICIFSGLPQWMGELGKLSVIKIAVRELWQRDIDILSRLNALSALSIYVSTAPAERIVFHNEGFRVLNHFKFICSALCIAFMKDAMPNVRRLKLGFSATALEQCSLVDAGFENLENLEVFTVNVGAAFSDEPLRKAVESALEDTFRMSGSRPVINVQLVNRTLYGHNEMRTMVRMGKRQTPEKHDVVTEGASEEPYRIGEIGSMEEDTSIQSDSSRITLSLESSSYTKSSGPPSWLKRSDGSVAQEKGGPGTGHVLEAPLPRKFTLAELREATRGFEEDMVLGAGSFGLVYKGWVDDERTLNPAKSGVGVMVAVKKHKRESLQGLREWQSETNFLGRLSHPNLVRLLGYCGEGRELLLVYEFMSKGSLDNYIFRRSGSTEPLSWSTRLKIAIGAARGLAFLHSLENQVIHRDVKTSNILLDSDFTAKLSGFGLAVEGPSAGTSYVTPPVAGTVGYIAPEYLMTGQLYVKSDVYGFGVVLLELLMGQRAYDHNQPAHQNNLVEWAPPYLSGRVKLTRLMDPRLGGQYPAKAALQAAKLAGNCLVRDPMIRPSMADVVAALEGVEAMQPPETGEKGHRRYLPPWPIARRSSPYINDSYSNLSRPPR